MSRQDAGTLAVRVQLWPGVEPPGEAAILAAFAAEGLHPYRWGNGPGAVYGAHSHPYHKVIIVVAGSITFGFPDSGAAQTLGAGDRLDLPREVRHEALVGPQGVVCLEAHRAV